VKKIYVGNLSWSTGENELRDLFASYGTVHSAAVIMDRETGRSRGFGFIEMDEADAERAIAELNGRDFGGRALRVNEAMDRGGERRGGMGGGGGRGGRGGFGGGGGGGRGGHGGGGGGRGDRW
jgi:hypothetical protein